MLVKPLSEGVSEEAGGSESSDSRIPGRGRISGAGFWRRSNGAQRGPPPSVSAGLPAFRQATSPLSRGLPCQYDDLTKGVARPAPLGRLRRARTNVPYARPPPQVPIARQRPFGRVRRSDPPACRLKPGGERVAGSPGAAEIVDPWGGVTRGVG